MRRHYAVNDSLVNKNVQGNQKLEKISELTSGSSANPNLWNGGNGLKSLPGSRSLRLDYRLSSLMCDDNVDNPQDFPQTSDVHVAKIQEINT
ncbi:MAG: hypothetical protein ACP5E5_07480 [Acidobacteriaceae bacterium]